MSKYTPLFSKEDKVDFWEVEKRINYHLHHVNYTDKVEDIKNGIEKAAPIMLEVKNAFNDYYKVIYESLKEFDKQDAISREDIYNIIKKVLRQYITAQDKAQFISKNIKELFLKNNQNKSITGNCNIDELKALIEKKLIDDSKEDKSKIKVLIEKRDSLIEEFSIVIQKIKEVQEERRTLFLLISEQTEYYNKRLNERKHEVRKALTKLNKCICLIETPMSEIQELSDTLVENLGDIYIDRRRYRIVSSYFPAYKTELLKERSNKLIAFDYQYYLDSGNIKWANIDLKNKEEKLISVIKLKFPNTFDKIKIEITLTLQEINYYIDLQNKGSNDFESKTSISTDVLDLVKSNLVHKKVKIKLRAFTIFQRLINSQELLELYFDQVKRIFSAIDEKFSWEKFINLLSIVSISEITNKSGKVNRKKYEANWQLNEELERIHFKYLLNQINQVTGEPDLKQKFQTFYKPEIKYYLKCSKKHIKDFNNKIKSNLPIKYEPFNIENPVLKDMLKFVDLRFSSKFRKIIEKIDRFVHYEYSAIIQENKERKDVEELFENLAFDLHSFLNEVKVKPYSIINYFLQSSMFTKTTDRLQIYGGAFGIWDQEEQKMVRLQDRRYCESQYRPGEDNKWYDIKNRSLLNEKDWERNRYGKSIGLMFLSERTQLLNPEFYQNFSEENNVLNQVERENKIIFCEDGEISAFVLIHRFMGMLFHTVEFDKENEAIGRKIKNASEEYVSKQYPNTDYLIKAFKQDKVPIQIRFHKPGKYDKEKRNDNNKKNDEISNLIYKLQASVENGNTALKAAIRELKIYKKNEYNQIQKTIQEFENQVKDNNSKIFKSIEEVEYWTENINKEIIAFDITEDISFSDVYYAIKNFDNLIEGTPNLKNIPQFINKELENAGLFDEDSIIEVMPKLPITWVISLMQKICSCQNLELKYLNSIKKTEEIVINTDVLNKLKVRPEFIKKLTTILKTEEISENEVDEINEVFSIDITEENIKSRIPYLKCIIYPLNIISYKKIAYSLLHHLIRFLISDEELQENEYEPLKLQYASPELSIDVESLSYDKAIEGNIRRNKFKKDVTNRINDHQDKNFFEELRIQGLVSKLDKDFDGKEQINYDPNYVSITERYVNLCRFIDRELDGSKRHTKVRCNYAESHISPINQEKYFIDRQLGKVNNEVIKESRETAIYKTRKIISSVVEDNYNLRKVEKAEFNKQLSRIVSLLLESIRPIITNKDFIKELKNEIVHLKEDSENKNLNKTWKTLKAQIDKISKFPLDPYFVWRSNNFYAHSHLAMPLSSTVTNKKSPDTGFLVLGFRNIYKNAKNELIHVTHETKEELKELIFTVKALFQPMIHPFMDRIYYEQIVSKSLEKQTITAGVAKVMARNLSHNIGSHVLATLVESDNFKFGDKEGEYSLENIGRLNKYLAERMELITDIATGTSSITTPIKVKNTLLNPLLKESGKEFQKILLDRIINIYTINSEDIKIVPAFYEDVNFNTETNEEDIIIDITNGLLGCHAFYVILENIIRNSAKHNRKETQKIDLLLRFSHIKEKKDFKKVRIVDKNSRISKDKLKDINTKIESSIIDVNRELRKDDWGLMEIKIGATYLRRIPIYNIDKKDKEFPILQAVLDSFNTSDEKGFLSYELYLENPKELHYLIAVSEKVKSIDTEILSNIGIKVDTRNLMNDYDYSTDYNVYIVPRDMKIPEEYLLGKRIVEKNNITMSIDYNIVNYKDKLYGIWQDWIKYLLKKKNINTINMCICLTDYHCIFYDFNAKDLRKEKNDNASQFYKNLDCDKVFNIVFTKHTEIKGIDSLTEKIDYYEDFSSSSITNTNLKTVIDLDFKEHLFLQLIEASISNVVIFDERIQKTCIDSKDKKELLSIPNESMGYFQILSKQNIYVPSTFELDQNNILKNTQIFNNIEKYLKEICQYNDFIIFHYSILEILWPDKSLIKEYISSIIKKYKCRVLIVSGRGEPLNKSINIPYISYTTLARYLFESKSKLQLVQHLYSLTMKAKHYDFKE